MKCKGICYRYAAKRPAGGYRFVAGQRPCSICGIFVDVNLFPVSRCPCCNNKLRQSSRNTKSRQNPFNILYKYNLLEKTSNMVRSLGTIRKQNQVKIVPTLK